MSGTAGVDERVLEAFRVGGTAEATSPLCRHLLMASLDDVTAGGPCRDVLAQVPPGVNPWADAVHLRFLGGVHRLVLDGEAPGLARHYPSAGGRFDPDAPGTTARDFVALVGERADDLVAALHRPVQTNEVGRAALLVGGYVEIARRTNLPLRVREIGASAGLNMRWDRFFYDTGATSFGDPGSGVRFSGVWAGPAPDLDATVEVADRAGCDANPLDPTDADGARALEAFIWPDQVARLERLRAAIEIARAVPARIVRADAGSWVEQELATPSLGVATVVVHSIVLQYLSRESRHQMRDAIRAAGALATPDASVHWLRMEPAGPVADLRLTSWAGGADDGVDEVLATSGFHGAPVWWGSDGSALAG